jgi:hypothetical protein
VLTTKFDILEKLNVPILQTGRSNIDSYKIVNIYKWRPALYIWQIGHTCMFSGYAHASRIIWLNFTQETTKCFKWQEYELKVKILSMHAEALVETIIMDTWNTLFGARTRKFWYFEDAPDCGFHGSDSNLSWDFHHIWLGFSDSWKALCPAAYIYVGHGRL